MATYDPQKLFLFGRDSVLKSPFPTYVSPKTLRLDEVRYLNDKDEVMAVEVDGGVRGFPVRVVAPHHIVEDDVAGRPVCVTF